MAGFWGKICTILATVLLSAALVVVGVLLGTNLSVRNGGIVTDNTSPPSEAPLDNIVEQPTDGGEGTIAIPGYEKLVMKAGELRQTVNFENPAVNDCYFRISITLADGTELYGSGLLKPGQTLETIEMTRALDTGTYKETVLKYDCFSVDDLSPLNGAKSILNLEVIP